MLGIEVEANFKKAQILLNIAQEKASELPDDTRPTKWLFLAFCIDKAHKAIEYCKK